MKKNDKARKEQKPEVRVSKQPKGVAELHDQDLERVQGGQSFSFGSSNPAMKP